MTSTGFGSQLSKSQFFHNYKRAGVVAADYYGVVAFTKHVPIPKIMCHAKRDRK